MPWHGYFEVRCPRTGALHYETLSEDDAVRYAQAVYRDTKRAPEVNAIAREPVTHG